MNFHSHRTATLRLAAPLAATLLALLYCGCNRTPAAPGARSAAAREAEEQAVTAAQAELAQIPLPTKSQYLGVHKLDNWLNPYLTVQANVISLHVLMPDENPSSLGEDSMLRPVGARRQVLTLRPDDLADALSAIPQNAWPYGRVIALEEQHGAAPSEEPAIRRNVEFTLKTLNTLGLVVDEWSEQNGSSN